MTRILLLGGTTEASQMARALADAGLDAVFSYAGRTARPVAQPLPTRVGGFGGAEGLARYIAAEAITHVVDATHPFAAQMSWNAAHACDASGAAHCILARPEWQPQEGDQWISVGDIPAAADALPEAAGRVFLAIGKQNLGLFAAKPQHHYLLRLVDAPGAPLPLPDATAVIARGPFTEAEDRALLQEHAITHVVAKNAGGSGAAAKLAAARALGLPVVMIQRPAAPAAARFGSPAEVMEWLGHAAPSEAERGV